MIYHYSFKPTTEIKVGDFIYKDGKWREIYNIGLDSGILISGFSWKCATELYYDWFDQPRMPDNSTETAPESVSRPTWPGIRDETCRGGVNEV